VESEWNENIFSVFLPQQPPHCRGFFAVWNGEWNAEWNAFQQAMSLLKNAEIIGIMRKRRNYANS